MALRCGIGHEDHAVHPLEHHLPGSGIDHGSGNGIDVEADPEPLDVAVSGRGEVEEQHPGVLDVHRLQGAAKFGLQLVVDMLKIGRFAGQPRTEKDDLCIYFTFCLIDQSHESPSKLSAVFFAEKDPAGL